MQISDLTAPVTASKADWSVATTWIGFTPTGADAKSLASCQSTINRQINNGYVLEYITESLSDPNEGFETHPDYLVEREQHGELAGRLVAVHRLLPTSLPLSKMVGDEEYQKIQDMWATQGQRIRWSVAFPIVESFEIVGKPKARGVFGEGPYRRLYGHASATLRPVNDAERASLAALEINPRAAKNNWILIDQEIRNAEAGDIDAKMLADLTDDLTDGALEGADAERKGKLRKRAAWLADRFARNRAKAGTLRCDACDFDPKELIGVRRVSARSLMDVHHRRPMLLGERVTEEKDLSLLCPTCHRFEHRLMTIGDSLFE